MAMLQHEHLFPSGEWGIWEIKETVDSWKSRLILSEEEEEAWKKMSERRRVEWAAARWLVHTLSGRKDRAILRKDEYGKPYLLDSRMNISISHSLERTAAIASSYKVGVDIQEIVKKMERISVKFINDKEWQMIPETESRLFYLHAIWGAKESMYKAWGKRGIDFKKQMKVFPFIWKEDGCSFRGRLKKNNICMHFDVYAKKLNHYIFVYAIEKYRVVS